MKVMGSEHANDRGGKNLRNRDDDGNYQQRIDVDDEYGDVEVTWTASYIMT